MVNAIANMTLLLVNYNYHWRGALLLVLGITRL